MATICTVAPLTKPVPVMVTDKFELFRVWVAGLSEVIVGAALTVNTLVPVPLPASVFNTVTLRAPVVALDVSVMFAVNEVGLLKVVEFTVMPVPENAATAPLAKPVPVIVMF